MVKTIAQYRELIETRLDIKGTLVLDGDKIVPMCVMNRKFIKDHHIDDLFEIHGGKPIFKNRMLSLVMELTDREIYTGHHALELKELLK